MTLPLLDGYRVLELTETPGGAFCGKLFADLSHMLVQDAEILTPQVFRNDMQLSFRFHIFELRHVLERKRQLEVVHNVKNDNIVAL